MKTKIWTSKNQKVRILERTDKATEKSVYDVQVKKNHIWCNCEIGLSAREVFEKYKLDTGSITESIKREVELKQLTEAEA